MRYTRSCLPVVIMNALQINPRKMKNLIILVLILAVSCGERETTSKEWVLQTTTQLNDVNPIGIALHDGALWLSDGDHNRLVQITEQGKIVKTIDSLERPMHIDADEETLYVPQYGMDNIATFKGEEKGALHMMDSLDAPAGISVFGKEKAIADFYNNRILYYNGTDWISFGKEGKANGEFYYPTDVQITSHKIWVADAYNHRIQVFDKKGNFIRMMGEEQKMNAATGIYISGDEVFVTDFENDRILIFDMDGNLRQALTEGLDKPTDMLIKNGFLHVINYRKGTISKYGQKEVTSDIKS